MVNSKILHPACWSAGALRLNNNLDIKPIKDAKIPPVKKINPFKSCLKNDVRTRQLVKTKGDNNVINLIKLLGDGDTGILYIYNEHFIYIQCSLLYEN